ncbi:MAG: VOC family protein [Solirubrobacteraceae bacterium]|nr:VOC family protein [Patulibacter sp.]
MTTSAAVAPVATATDFVTIPTQDLGRAVAFYRDVLGLPCTALYQRGDGPAIGAEFDTGNVTLSVLHVESVGITFAPLTGPLALRVDDVAAARATIEARGVEFRADTMDTSVCHMAHFRDPDGNPLMLHRRYAASNPVPTAAAVDAVIAG